MKFAANINDIQPEVKHRYELTTMKVDDCGDLSYTTYGFKVLDENGSMLLFYPDIATSKEKVTHLIDMLEKHSAALVHVRDIIEDFLI